MLQSKTPIMRSVPYVELSRQTTEEGAALLECAERVFTRADYILGAAVEELEQQLAKYIGVPYVVGVGSGTDALILGMRALGMNPGDEVITPPNSFVSSTSAIVLAGLKPVFADVLPDQNIDPAAVESVITPRTRAIMPVHLTGRMCEMDALQAIAEKHDLYIIEDAAQSIGSLHRGRQAGSIGDIGCFSGHPLKNLNACGDAGFVATRDAEVADKMRILRNIGMKDRNTVLEWSSVSRPDTLQAEILKMRLPRLISVIERRRANASLYRRLLNPSAVFMPPCRDYEYNSFHTFVCQVDHRTELQKYLSDRGIGTTIHYPVPIHVQPVARELGYKLGDFPVTERQAARILSLPIHQFLSTDDIEYVSSCINEFFE